MPILAQAQAAQRPVPRDLAGGRALTNVPDAWRLLSWIGGGLLFLGLTDIALAWYPMRFGNPDWEFGIIGGTMGALGLPHLGLYLLLASAIARGKRATRRVLGGVLILFLLTLLGLGLTFLTVVPLALKAMAANPLVAQGAKKAILKALILGSGFCILDLVGAHAALRKRTES